MEENKLTLELLAQIEKNSRWQARFAALQCVLSLVSAVFFAAGLYLIWQLLPLVSQVLPQISGILGQLEAVFANLESVTEQLAQIDLTGMVTGVESLVGTAQQTLSDTLNKLNTIDFQTLNKAIEDLAAVVEPLSKMLRALS